MFSFDTITTHRRGFLTRMAGAVGLAAIAPGRLLAEPPLRGEDPKLEAWFDRVKGQHRIVFDAPAPNGGMPVVWPRVYLDTMNATYGTTDADNAAVVILRHEAVGLALGDAMWAKYKLGEQLKVDDSGKPATRNVYATITGLPIEGVGVLEVLKAGVLVGVCNVALSVAAATFAAAAGTSADTVKQELLANVYPGIQVVPSGVMAVGRSQEKGCNYCFAG